MHGPLGPSARSKGRMTGEETWTKERCGEGIGGAAHTKGEGPASVRLSLWPLLANGFGE
jgi:hypothetical protein